jgi:hypothetical protein
MIRKKWFGWGLLILLVLGIIVFWMRGALKTNLVEVEEKTGGELERVVAVEAGKEQELKQIMGIVDNWDAKSGKLVFMEDRIRHEVLVDPGNMRVMVNSLKEKGRDLVLSSREDLNWRGAFCRGDMVVLRISLEDEPVFIINNGYRRCGFKGE